MDKNRDYIWSFPLVGAIITIIGLFTPASLFSTNFIWMWGFSFFDGGPPYFYWSLLLFFVYLTPFVLLLGSVAFSVILSMLIRQNGDFKQFQKMLLINAGLFIGGSVIYFITSFSLIWPFWQFYRPGFAMIAPFISGGVLIFGTLFNTRFLMQRSQKPDLILKIKKFYKNILLTLSFGGALFLIGTILAILFFFFFHMEILL